MKIGYKDLWIDLTLPNVKNRVKEWLDRISKDRDDKKVKNYSVALIDERYYETGYIIDYGKIHCSKRDFAEINFTTHLTMIDLLGGLTLEKLFTDETKSYLIESTGELNGFENDTPELIEFDFIIKV